MKRCSCGRLATHFVVLLQPDGEPKGKKLMCDSFPKCAANRAWHELDAARLKEGGGK